ncbi:MAG: hypothetical protein P0Y56_00340 [Candidatus Andeanibacterium colombiense]|uniref:Uncharacterized protein n=1 Tax=Candidatus Andeanibacterium colombiense TaxID=3121345 RepID=A0AAJ5X704_9SPHN|nr:MAG: hypothetical protein P0Y56_00340 [Sphingomonadaceae bacterium]
MLNIRLLKRLLADPRASVATIAALSLPVTLGGLGLGVDLNHGYEQRLINQRAADMAALGAAMAYKASSATAVLQPTAVDITTANGLTGATVTATVVDNYPSAGSKAVKVVVKKTVPFTLARVVGLGASYTVTSEAYASLNTAAAYSAPCFLALASGSGAITLTGGATITAAGCSIAAVGSISQGATSITAADVISGTGGVSLDYGSISVSNSLRFSTTFTYPSWNGAIPDASKRVNQSTTLTDPWATDSELLAARAQLGTYTAVPALSNPTTPTGADWTMGWSPTANVTAYRTGPYTGEYVVPAGTYNIKRLTIDGGIKVTFANNSVITVSNGVAIGGGSTIDFGNSTLYVNGGFDTGSSGIKIGNGPLWIGSGTVNFQGTNTKGTGDVIINSKLTLGGGQRLTMGAGNHSFAGLALSGGGSVALGTGNFTNTAGITIDGDSELAVSAGNVLLGPNPSGGLSANLAGSARFFMEDGTFSANGGITTQGGSRLVFGKTANHYINGSLNIAGSVLFGAGRYTINGNFVNGTGGTTWPYTSSLTGKTYGNTLEGVSVSGYDQAGVNVSFILAGTLNLAGGAKTKLIASTTSSTGSYIADMLVDSLTSSATTWGAGASNIFVGTVHLPNSTVSMSGGNATLSAGQCFTLIAAKISVTGGAQAGTACAKMSGTSSASGSSTDIKLLK